MDLYWKAAGCILIAAVLSIALERHGKDFSMLITLSASVMSAVAAGAYLKPVMDYLSTLATLGNLNNDMLLILMKILGIGVAGEIAGTVCTDAGNSSLGKSMKFLSNAAILYLSIPVYTALTDLLRQILGDV